MNDIIDNKMLDSLNQGVLILDSDGTIISVNREVRARIGNGTEKVIGRHLADVFHEDDKDVVRGFLKELKTDKSSQVTARPDSSLGLYYAHLEMHGSVYEDDGRRYYIVLIFDVTDRNLTIYRQLFINEFDRFRLSAKTESAAIKEPCSSLCNLISADRVFVTGAGPGPSSTEVLIDCEFTRNKNGKSLEGTNLPANTILLPVSLDQPFIVKTTDEKKAGREYYTLLKKIGIQTSVIFKVPSPDDKQCLLHICFEKAEVRWGDPETKIALEATAGIGDILDIARLSYQADSEEQRYRTLFRQIPIALLILEGDGTLSDYNTAARNLLNLNPRTNSNFNIFDFFPEGESSTALAILNSALERDQLQTSGTMCTPQGRNFRFEAKVLPFFNNRIIMVIDDVNQQKATAEHLLNTQKMKSIGLLAGGIANDYNNILSAILGYVSYLKQATIEDLPKDVSESVDKIEQASKKGAKLTRKLASLSLNEDFSSEIIDIVSLLYDVIRGFSGNLEENFDLVLNLPTQPQFISGDNSQLHQMFTNLLINATEAMKENDGRLTVNFKQCYPDDSAFPIERAGNLAETYYCISIVDTGKGMSREVKDRIFEPFFTTKSSGENTGLGLSLVYSIVRNHDGIINVDSMPFSGTTVEIILPANETPASKEPSPEKSGRKKPFKVLVVDDEEIIRDMAALFLRRFGMEPVVAENGEKAVKIFKENHSEIDLVLMDIIMPIMDGREAAFKIKEIDPEISIIFTSGYSHDPSFMQSIKYASIGFLSKPYKLKDFVTAIYGALGLKDVPDLE